MNKIIVIGRLTADPQSGKMNDIEFSKFTVASNRSKEEADFFRVVAWRKTAEICNKYLNKGKQVAVVGTVKTGSYEKDGVKIPTFDITAENVELIGSAQNTAEKPPKGATPTTDDDMPF